MSNELKDSLIYDCNYNLFLAKTMLPNIRNIQGLLLHIIPSSIINIDQIYV